MRQSSTRLTDADLVEVLDVCWWNLVRYRLKEIGQSDLGLNTVEMLFIDDEGNAVDDFHRDMRDAWRDVRSDRPMP